MAGRPPVEGTCPASMTTPSSMSAAVRRLIVAGLRPVKDPSCWRDRAPDLRSASMMAVWLTRASVLVVAVLRSCLDMAPPLATTSDQVCDLYYHTADKWWVT